MEDKIANVASYAFEIESLLDSQINSKSLPFTGMDKSQVELCAHFLRGHCPKGPLCSYRHSRQDASIVCKHWLRHLCKKGDDCEFLHLYDMMRMPECHYFQKYGECHNKDCPFLHGDQDARTRDCPWYDKGFCKHGPSCRNRHTQKVMCMNYYAGFCPDGPKCKFTHVKFDLSTEQHSKSSGIIIDTPSVLSTSTSTSVPYSGRPLDQVTCFKCKQKGHYANVCPQSYKMKLLQQQLLQQQQQQQNIPPTHEAMA